MGLLGFPGVGWLFAGFPFTATILLLAGPGVAWALIPLASTPYADVPFQGLGIAPELVWLPTSTLVSAAFLYRAQRRRRIRLLGAPPRRRRRLRGGYRTRVSVALGAIGLLLASIPFVPAVTGIGGSSVRYSYQTGFTSEITGQFLTSPRGTIKLFAWRDPQERFPSDALRLHADDVRSLVVRAAAIDRTGAYQLFDLTHGSSVPLAMQSRSSRILELTPARRLAPGRYLFVASHEGMFGGRDYSYLRVVDPGEAVTAIARRPHATAPAVLDAVLPVAASLLAALFALLLLRSLVRRPAGQKALWATGFALFSVATTCEALAQRHGWSPALFRAYYLAGGVLAVAYLGAGSAWLLLPRRGRDALAGALAVATLAATVSVLLAHVDPTELLRAPSGRPPVNGALAGHAFLWAVALNSLGTLALIGCSVLSIVRHQRVRANLWIAGGALVVAAATGLSRAGDYSFVYLGELVGIGLMFAGFTVVGRRREPGRVPERVPEPRATAPAA